MAHYITVHMHNIANGREGEYEAWFDTAHSDALESLTGFRKVDRFAISDVQIMADIDHPWRFMSMYEFDYDVPDRDIPKLGLLLEDARRAGLLEDSNQAERIWSFNMYSDWYFSPNWQQDKPFSGVSVLFGNFVQGREQEYHDWYDNIHAPEVTRVPGHVGMKRGRLAGTQCEPRRYCPGSELVLCAQQTDDMMFTVRDFSARARGVSKSGIAMEPRSTAGSFARTIHYYQKIGSDVWPGGIAYDGDLSIYEDKE